MVGAALRLTAFEPSTCTGDVDRNRSMRRRVVVAATIGNTLEWYDFLVYGFLAVTIAKLFFPTGLN
jgi:MHS family proline/betaine transporter-like MFS transporter